MDAFLDGMERAVKAGRDVTDLASVASFFVSRVDTEIDARLDKIGTDEAKALRGAGRHRQRPPRVRGVREGLRRRPLAGARGRRAPSHSGPLWASTGVKDPAYDDTRYVVDLVAPGIVNTMPEATLDAVADHGVFRGDTIRGTLRRGRARRSTRSRPSASV